MNRMYDYILTYRLIDDYNCSMVSITVNLEVMSSVAQQQNQTLVGGMKCKEGIQPRYTKILAKT